ncbi:MAG: InlB B-repeat-containing protein, partial [Clostridia bacterium]|nr:InlB B-repeat-containing protein [Clostridia bacterium]
TDYAEIDKGIYTTVHTINVSDLYSGNGEIPEGGLTVYARAWVDETEEPVTSNNDGFVYFQGLVTRNNGARLTTDTSLEENDGSYTVSAEIRNNSMLDVNAGIPVAVLLDGNGNIIAHKNFQDTELFISKESRIDGLSVTFTAGEIEGTPAQAEIRYLYTVSFDVNGGTGEFADVTTDIDGYITLPEGQPTPSQNVPTLFFRGWYSSPTGGELITGNTLFNNHTTVYARYTPHQHVFECIENNGDTVTVKCVSTAEDDCPLEDVERTVTLTIVVPERAATGYGMPNATIIGAIDKYSMPEICYYTATAVGERGEALTSAPVDAGKYWAEFTLNDGGSGITAYVVYEIPYIEGVIANNVQVPNFVKVTDPAALNTLTACSAAEAYAWISVNANMLSAGDPWAEKIVVYGKKYDDNTEYAVCFVYMYSRWEIQEFDLNELTYRISNAMGEVYIKGAGGTQMVSGVEFGIVTSREDLTAVSCTELDAVLWILANINRYPQGMVVFAVDNENCSCIRYTAKSVTIQNTRTRWLLDESQMYGMPVFIARPSDVLNPYKTYTINYNANGGTGTAGGTYYVKSNVEIVDGDGFAKPNLVFDGWNTKANGTGDAYKPGDKFEVLGDTTLYAQWKHVHNWSIAYNEDTHVFTATCNVPGCPHGSLTLHSEAVDKMYDGENAEPYTRSNEWTKENGLPIPTVKYYVNGEEVAEAKNVGAYTAVVSLDGHDVEVGEFHITKRPIIVIADDKEIHEGEEDPDLTVSYDSVGAGLCFDNDATYPWQIVTEGDRIYVKSGNGGQGSTTSTLTLKVTLAEAGTLSFNYKYGTENRFDWCYFRLDGTEKIKVSNIGDWQTYSCELTAGEHTLTWAYSKDGGSDNNGDFFAVDNVEITTNGDVTQEDAVTNELTRALNVYEGGIVEGDTLNYTIKREEGDGMGTYVITVTMGENPNYDVKEVRNGTFTILESLGEPQIIVVSDLTATYGDTGVKINASITTGDGSLSYVVKSGDAVAVDDLGNLTIIKAGTAVITVIASKTEVYARTTKNITVTIEPKEMTVSAGDINATVNGHPHGITVTVTDPAQGYTVKYGTVEGTYNLTASPTLTEAGTTTVYYQVTADNYETFTGSATVTLVNHTHVLTYTVGTGENANTIIATCSADDCPFPANTATLTIEAPTGAIVYDGAAHPAVITDEYGIRGNVKVLYAMKGVDGTYGTPSETAPVNVGTYKASITLGTGDDAVTASVTYAIAKKAASITAADKSKTYGADDPTLTATVEGLVGEDTINYTLSRAEGNNVGEY